MTDLAGSVCNQAVSGVRVLDVDIERWHRHEVVRVEDQCVGRFDVYGDGGEAGEGLGLVDVEAVDGLAIPTFEVGELGDGAADLGGEVLLAVGGEDCGGLAGGVEEDAAVGAAV